MPLILPPLKAPIWSKQFLLIGLAPTGVTGFTAMGGNTNSTGTFSSITTSETSGIMSQNTSTAAINALCGTAGVRAAFCRGSVAGQFNGFRMFARVYYPDASYNNTGASTGSRIFLGFTNQSSTNSVASDDPAGSRCGFSRINVNGALTDTNWFVTTKDGLTEHREDTGIAFTVQHVYDFYMTCEPMGQAISWEILDRTADTSSSGILTTELPPAATLLTFMHMLRTINAAARAIGFQRFYVETGI